MRVVNLDRLKLGVDEKKDFKPTYEILVGRKKVIDELKKRARDNTPEDIRVAVPWFKPSRNETDILPDYYEHETAEWLVFPHELDALTPEELRAERPAIASIIEGAKKSAAAG